MSPGGKREREERALDALLVSALRRDSQDAERVDPDRLPQLNEDEKAALNALGSDFVKHLLAGERPLATESGSQHADDDCGYVQGELALSWSGTDYALNRAEDIDGDTTEELERRKREILERKARERTDAGGGAS